MNQTSSSIVTDQPPALTRDQVAALLAEPLFRSWLMQHPASAIVGQCALPGTCPLRNYLADQGVPEPTVSGSVVDWPVRGRHYFTVRLPEWAQAFVKGVDVLYPAAYDRHPGVTAADAIRVLDQRYVGIAA